jgi:NADPH-dependent 2,4-dienoyl-CoA reductase/sulfur reductase-like enzyme
MARNNIVIVGGAAAGMTAATRIRRNRPEASVTVIEKGAYISYAACGLPYYVSDDIKDINKLILYTPQEIYDTYKIRVLTGHQVLNLHARNRQLEVRNLETGRISDIGYDRLILATGASPVIPDIPGSTLDGVYGLRNIDDALALKKNLESGLTRRAIIVGSGYLGLEMAEVLRKHSVDVLLIEAKPHLIDPFELEIASMVKNELLYNGCQIQKSVRLSGINGSSEGIHSVELDNGAEVLTDMVVFAAGIKPNVSLAKQAGISLGKSGAIRINNKQETSLQGVYAIGDCAEVRHRVTGKYVYSPQATSALKQARVAADNASGKFTKFEGITGTAIVKLFNLHVGRTGIDKSIVQALNLNVETATVEATSRAAYYPGAENLTAKIFFNTSDGQLLGAQMAGREGIAAGIDVFSSALHNKMTVFDMLHLDLSYTPPVAAAWNPVLLCAMQAVKKLNRRF